MRNDPTSAIFDYQVSSAERFKNGSQDSDSHSPLMVYIRSRSAARQRNFERPKEHLNPGLTKSTTNSTGAIQSNGKTMATRPGMIMETMAVNPQVVPLIT